ncbi:hypothetical protein ACXZ1K_13425 [Pedobacter sp. PWIIR3]
MQSFSIACFLSICIAFNNPVDAQLVQSALKVTPIKVEDAARYIGKLVSVNYSTHRTVDDGKSLLISRKVIAKEKPLTIVVTGEARKQLLDDQRFRRKLNTQVKSPLDTSITAIGKIVLYQGQLKMLVDNPKKVYMGVDLFLDTP